jgi:hypothetical protein
MKNNYEMKNGKVTVILSGSNSDGQFNFESVKVSTKPNVIFRRYTYGQKAPEGMELVSLGDYIYDKVKATADTALKDYIAKHINDMDFYYEKSEEYGYAFFDSANNWKDEYPKMDRDICISLSDVAEGIITGSVHGYLFTYDLVKDKFTSLRSHSYNGSQEIEPLRVIYGQHLRFILALEQYRLGKAHPAFTEVVNLNKFLDGKRSVKLNMKNGKTYELKTRHNGDVYAGQIIEFIKGKFYLNDNYDLKPRLNLKYGDHMEVSELESITYAKQSYTLNPKNLVLKEPKAKTKKSKNAAK